MKNFNKENGITLVALIITIIVLLILAMVSIRLVMNGGIIDRAEKGTQAYSEAEIQEQIKLAYAEWQTAQFTSDAGDAATFMQGRLRTSLKDNGLTVTGSFKITLSNGKEYFYNAKSGQMADSELDIYPSTTASTKNDPVPENSKYVSGDFTAIIPAGYTISNEANEQSIENGLVVKKDGNEWVWIPVSDTELAAMYETSNTDTDWTMCGTSEKNAVITKYKSKLEIVETRDSRANGNPGQEKVYNEFYNSYYYAYREPDMLNNVEYDNNSTNLASAGFNSYTEMATELKNDYRNMIDSIKKFGGFYVGRYELGTNGIKKGIVMNNKNWYELYAACKNFENDSVYSRMLWGCTWEQICRFINLHGDKVDLENPTSYGNYPNSTADAELSGRSNFNDTTGRSEKWKTNNIYDLAGNCWEWAQTAHFDEHRLVYGGFYGTYLSLSDWAFLNPTQYGRGTSSRPVLYIK